MTTATSITTESLRSRIANELDALIDVRHDLHAHPELAYTEHRTSGVVQRELEAVGVEFAADLAGGTGVLGHIGNGTDRAAVGLRADMDALPITELTNLPYSSTTQGIMHACGHDGHTTILIGAARVLAAIQRDLGLPRPVSLVFQPAEEGGAGGRRMVEDGCLTGNLIGTPVERMFGLHGWPQLGIGRVSTRPGPMLAAADMFTLEFTGIGGHAAYPHICADPIVCAAAFTTAAQSIVSRNVSPLDSAVISITQIHAGTTHNIIPQKALVTGTVRTLLPETRTRVFERLETVANQIAAAHECRADLAMMDGYPVTRNDETAVDFFNQVASTSLGADRVEPLPEPVMGGEDFSFYCREVPSCFFALGLLPEGSATMPQLHQPDFDFNDDAIATGVEVFCQLALSA